ncbi:hypothetical protein EMPS_10216 [Entomortierella parvispora]|uniref:Copper-fist domain-containing protein n=1 Tax=Entomortierella parvispora TaxID=205924 RepID=A0A9P3M140_9FUNG|nr:hypothetical protein EMPS_10216 [Entomortierella parvispora]
MVVVNGQKFACETCIKGHRSSSCNHSDRPLHEVKKKGRPSTQCLHCKDLRKAKQVQVRCKCSQDEALGTGSAASSDSQSCGCLSGAICTCCRDREGHVVVKPGKGPSRAGIFRSYKATHQPGSSLNSDKSNLRHSASTNESHSYLSATGFQASPTFSSLNSTPSQLCHDLGSSSEYDSDQYNSPPPQPYFPQGNQASMAIDQGIGIGPYLNGITASIPNQPSKPTPTKAPVLTTPKSCCKPELSNVQELPTAGNCSSSPSGPGAGGCGCSISANMCCCGELCACPGCLAYPSNENVLDAAFDPTGVLTVGSSCGGNSNIIPTQSLIAQNPQPKGSCCGSKGYNSVPGDSSAITIAQALNLIGASDNDSESNHALRQTLSSRGITGLESMKMQHPTVVGDNGVLICGCGCGRPTVDCVDCFRDMVAFVGESQAQMLKDEQELEMSMNQDGGYLADFGLNMNLSRPLHIPMNSAMDISLDSDINTISFNEGPLGFSLQPEGALTREQQERLRQHRMEQEQLQLSQMQSLPLDQLQLDFLDDADWSFVDEIRSDGPDHSMSGVEPA